MQNTVTNFIAAQPSGQRVNELFTELQQNIYKHTDRMFAFLMAVQWVAAIAAAIWISPRTWVGAESQIHLHVWASVFLGSAISFLPIALALLRPGKPSTRYVIATGQMLMGALLIHLSGGRIETHFHIFGSLAFLAFYRDWRVLVPATLVVVLDHVLRGILFPQSIFGVLASTHWRWLEHAGWVVFIDIFLVISCLRSTREMRDIAARATAVEKSEDRYRELFDNANDIIYTRDLKGNITSLNKTGERITGYSRDEALMMNLAQVVAPEYLEQARQMLARGIDEQTPTAYEFEIVSKTGERKLLEVSTRLTYENGVPFGAQCIGRDITPRKEAEAALKREREFLSTILENITDGIVACDANGTLSLFNRVTREFHGLPEISIPADQWADHFDLYQEDGKTPLETEQLPLLRALHDGSVRDAEVVIAPKNTAPRRVKVSGQAIFDGKGEKSGAVVVMHDITKTKLNRG